jgi:hypothetical protein
MSPVSSPLVVGFRTVPLSIEIEVGEQGSLAEHAALHQGDRFRRHVGA